MAEGQTKTVLILGAGFAGVRAAVTLGRWVARTHAVVAVRLVDPKSYHEYHACFYELATAERAVAPAAALRAEACPAIADILRGLPVEHVQAVVERIDHARRIVETDAGPLAYDVLIVGLGSTTNFFGIPGLAGHSLTLKTMADAIRIRNRVEQIVQAATASPAQIVIGGGGFTGCELAAELVHYLQHLSQRFHGHTRQVRLTVLEACPTILPGLPASLVAIVHQRLAALGVEVTTGQCVTRVEPSALIVQGTDRSVPYDLLIWTGGITASPVVAQAFPPGNRSGHVRVDEHLRPPGIRNVFVVGDAAAFRDPATQRTVPALATIAIQEGECSAQNAVRLLTDRPLAPFRPRASGFVIPVGGKFAIAEFRRLRFVGVLGWLMRRLIDLRYYLSILPFGRALALWWRGTMTFVKND